MTAFIDRTGQKYHMLTVLERVPCPVEHANEAYRKAPWWSCKCDCGNVVVRNGNNMVSGASKSCGCLIKRADQNRVGKPHARRPNRVKRDVSKWHEARGYTDQEVIDLIDKGKTIDYITDWLGCEAYKIHKIARKFGRKVSAAPRGLTQQEIQRIKAGIDAGQTIRTISQEIGRAKETVLKCSWMFRPKGSRYAAGAQA